MDLFKQYIESFDDFDDFFPDTGKHSVVSAAEQPKPFTLKLWRGFNADYTLEQDSQHYFSPKRAEQGQMWFTHPYVNYYNPVQYAKDHGRWLTTYELPTTKHEQVLTWSGGHRSSSLPDWWVVPSDNEEE